jgi:hypothetical protein
MISCREENRSGFASVITHESKVFEDESGQEQQEGFEAFNASNPLLEHLEIRYGAQPIGSPEVIKFA